MRTDQEIKEIINLYILDSLDDNERAEAEEYLKQEEYLKYYKETNFILGETAFSIEDVSLPENLKSELLNKIDTIEQQNTGKSDNVYSFPKMGYAIAASIIAVLFIYSFYLIGKLDDQAKLIAQLKDETKHSQDYINFIDDPNVSALVAREPCRPIDGLHVWRGGAAVLLPHTVGDAVRSPRRGAAC